MNATDQTVATTTTTTNNMTTGSLMRLSVMLAFFCLLSIPFYGQDCVTGYCPKTLTAHHEASFVAATELTVTYPIVETNLSGTNMCWITQNLGASEQATSATDNRDVAAGWYWQFNRKQGYAWDSGTSTRTPNTPWITEIDEDSDWLPENDPCSILLGTGWRLPTYTEWRTADGADAPGGNWENYDNTYDSVLKLHAAGSLYYSSAALTNRGTNGYYWSSVRHSIPYGYRLGFSSGSAGMYYNDRAHGYSVRCLRELN